MKPMDEPTDTILRDWLLGKLAACEAEPLEERLLRDEVLSRRVDAVEIDLLDDVANARLDGEDRAAALRLLAATPKDRQRLRIARALARALPAQQSASARDGEAVAVPRRSSATPKFQLRWPVFAGGALAAACLALVVVEVQRRGAVDVAPRTESAALASITLMSSQQRGAPQGAIGIARSAATVRLQLEVDASDATSRYDLRIEDQGRTVFDAENLPVREAGAYRFVEAAVPASVFADGEHTVRVHAAGETAPEQTWSIHTRRE
jgi:hypothetical protein